MKVAFTKGFLFFGIFLSFLPLKTWACSYTFGVVPQFEQRRLYSVWSAVLTELGSKTGCAFQIMGSENINEFEKAFQAGIYDFAYMNPYHAVMAKKSEGYEPIIRSGAEKLQGIVVVHKDASLQSVADLEGRELAFPSPNALGASLLVRAELKAKNNISIKPKYVKTHSSVYLHVAKGLTIAGGGIKRTLEEQPGYVQKSLRVFYTTFAVNAHPVVVHPRVPEVFVNTIRSVWIELAHEKPELFDEIPMKRPVKASYEDYKELETLGLSDFVELQN